MARAQKVLKGARPNLASTQNRGCPMVQLQPGVYGFVSHSFANVQKGETGAIDVAAVRGTMTH
jgi:hypothetical protein